MYNPYKKPPQIYCDVRRGLTTRQSNADITQSQAANHHRLLIESRDTNPSRMQEVNIAVLCTDIRALRTEYCIVGIPHDTAI